MVLLLLLLLKSVQAEGNIVINMKNQKRCVFTLLVLMLYTESEDLWFSFLVLPFIFHVACIYFGCFHSFDKNMGILSLAIT